MSNLPDMQEAVEELEIEWPRTNKIYCPLCESEETPALHLSEDHWYCFSCGKHGDGIGLIAAYTGVNVRTLVAQRGGDRSHKRATTKVMTRQGVTRAVFMQYRDLHDWWFRTLHQTYATAEMWAFERALDLWSDVFDQLVDEIRGDGMWFGDDPLPPFRAEQKIAELKRQLVVALPFEEKDARELRMR